MKKVIVRKKTKKKDTKKTGVTNPPKAKSDKIILKKPKKPTPKKITAHDK